MKPVAMVSWSTYRSLVNFRIRLGSLIVLLALGWPMILPGILALIPDYVQFEFNSLPALVWVWFPSAVALAIGLLISLTPGVRQWRVPSRITALFVALIIAGGSRVAWEHGVDLTVRTVVLGPLAVPTLMRVLAAETISSRITARSKVARDDVLLLGHRGVPRLVTALKDPEWAVRSSSAGVLAQLGERAASAEGALVETLKDPDTRVSTAAADAVLRVAPTTRFNVSVLVDIVNSGESLARVDAAIALAALGPTAAPAAPALAAALKDPNWAMRVNAAEALGNIGPAAETAIPALTEALTDGEPRVRSSATAALERIKGQ